MERKEASNGLQLIKIASIKLRGNFVTLFMGALAMTTPLILILFMSALLAVLFNIGWFLPIGVALFAIFVGPLQVGYIKYFNGVLDGKQPRISLVYSQLRFNVFTLRTIYISTLLMVLYIVGGILWMVPAGFAISFYSMTLFFLEKYEYPRLSQALNECSHKMVGNRLAMFSYKLIFYFVYMMLFVLAGLLLALVYTLSIENLLISWLIAVCSAIVFIFLYTLVTVYFHSSNQIFFEDVLSRDEKKRASKVKTTTNIASNLESAEDGESGKKALEKDIEKKDTEVEKLAEEKEIKEVEKKGNHSKQEKTTKEENKKTAKKASKSKETKKKTESKTVKKETAKKSK